MKNPAKLPGLSSIVPALGFVGTLYAAGCDGGTLLACGCLFAASAELAKAMSWRLWK